MLRLASMLIGALTRNAIFSSVHKKLPYMLPDHQGHLLTFSVALPTSTAPVSFSPGVLAPKVSPERPEGRIPFISETEGPNSYIEMRSCGQVALCTWHGGVEGIVGVLEPSAQVFLVHLIGAHVPIVLAKFGQVIHGQRAKRQRILDLLEDLVPLGSLLRGLHDIVDNLMMPVTKLWEICDQQGAYFLAMAQIAGYQCYAADHV